MASVGVETDTHIVVTHVADSTLVGTVQRFTKRRVLIGRRSANDVRFDKNRDLTVSGYHAELYVSDGKLFVHDVGSRNGTFVNDQPIDGPYELSPDDIVTLGVPGAKIQAKFEKAPLPGFSTDENLSTAEAKRSVGLTTVGKIIDLVVATERNRSRRGFLIMTVFMILISITGVALLYFQEDRLLQRQEEIRASSNLQQQQLVATQEALKQTDERLSAAEKALQSVRERNEAQVTERLLLLEKKLDQLKGHITAEDARISRLMVEIEERDAVVRRLQNDQQVSQNQRDLLTGETNRQIAALKAELAETQSQVRERQTRQETWSDLVEKYHESVFLCLGYSSDAGQGIGTGFVIRADGLLATNAHVVKVLEKYSEHFAIQNGTGKVFRISKMVAHPQHRGLQSPDVGLIQIDMQGETLRPFDLATESTLEQLRIGTQLGTLGFPGELTPAYLRDFVPNKEFVRTVQATFKDGWVGRITNYRFENDDQQFSKYIQHSASLSPGTSGSPMFNLKGEVIAVNSGTLQIESDLTIEVDGRKQTTTVTNPSAAEIAFAIRVDELRTVLENFRD